MTLTTTQGSIYLTAVSSLESLELQFVPKTLNKSRDISNASIAVVGRNNPFIHYTGGTTTLDFDIDFHADADNRQDVIRKCNWLESLGYNDMNKPPELVILTFGDIFRRTREQWVVKKVTPSFNNFDSEFGFLPKQATVSIGLELVTKVNIHASDVKWLDATNEDILNNVPTFQ